MNSTSLSVEIFQMEHVLGSVDKNLEVIMRSINGSDSDLLVFPEMFLSGYTLGKDTFSTAMDADDARFQPLLDAARKNRKFLIFGFPERSDRIRGQVHNSAMIIGPDGLIGVYRKIHLVDFGPFEEYAYFTPGVEPFMFEANGFKIGMMICYDIFFPELVKQYALNGADAVVCISASPSVTRTFFESLMRARAIESTVYFIYSNLVGFDSKMDFWGGGAMIGPRGNRISKGPYYKEARITGILEDVEIRRARSLRPTLRDTKPHISDLLCRWGKGER